MLSDTHRVKIYQCSFRLNIKEAIAVMKFPSNLFVQWKTKSGKKSVCTAKRIPPVQGKAIFNEILEFQAEVIHDEIKDKFVKKQSVLELNLVTNAQPNKPRLVGRLNIDLAQVLNDNKYAQLQPHSLQYTSVGATIAFNIEKVNQQLTNKQIKDLDKDSFSEHYSLYSLKLGDGRSDAYSRRSKNPPPIKQPIPVIQQEPKKNFIRSTILRKNAPQTNQKQSSNINILKDLDQEPKIQQKPAPKVIEAKKILSKQQPTSKVPQQQTPFDAQQSPISKQNSPLSKIPINKNQQKEQTASIIKITPTSQNLDAPLNSEQNLKHFRIVEKSEKQSEQSDFQRQSKMSSMTPINKLQTDVDRRIVRDQLQPQLLPNFQMKPPTKSFSERPFEVNMGEPIKNIRAEQIPSVMPKSKMNQTLLANTEKTQIPLKISKQPIVSDQISIKTIPQQSKIPSNQRKYEEMQMNFQAFKQKLSNELKNQKQKREQIEEQMKNILTGKDQPASKQTDKIKQLMDRTIKQQRQKRQLAEKLVNQLQQKIVQQNLKNLEPCSECQKKNSQIEQLQVYIQSINKNLLFQQQEDQRKQKQLEDEISSLKAANNAVNEEINVWRIKVQNLEQEIFKQKTNKMSSQDSSKKQLQEQFKKANQMNKDLAQRDQQLAKAIQNYEQLSRQSNDLKQQIQDTKSNLAIAQDQLKKNRQQIKMLNNETVQKQSEIKQKDASISSLQQANHKLSKKIQQLQESNKEIKQSLLSTQQQMNNLWQQLEAKKNQLTTMKTEIQNLQNEKKLSTMSSNEQIQELQFQTNALRSTANQLQRNVQQLTDKNSLLERQKEELLQKLCQLDEQKNSIIEDLNKVQNLNLQLEKQILKLTEEKDALIHALSNLQDNNGKLIEEKTNLQAYISQIQVKNGELSVQKSQLQQKVEEFTKEILAAHQLAQQRQIEIQGLNNTVSNNVEEKDKMIETLTQLQMMLNSQIKQKQTKEQQLLKKEKQLKDIQGRLSTLESQLLITQNQMKRISQQKSSLQEEKKSLEQKFEAEKQKYTDDGQNKEIRLKSLEKQLNETRNKNEQLIAMSNSLKGQDNDLMKQLNASQSNNTQLKNNIQQMEGQIAELNGRLEAQMEVNQELKDKIEKYHEKELKLKKHLSILEEESKKIFETTQAKQENQLQLAQMIEEKQAIIKQLQNRILSLEGKTENTQAYYSQQNNKLNQKLAALSSLLEQKQIQLYEANESKNQHTLVMEQKNSLIALLQQKIHQHIQQKQESERILTARLNAKEEELSNQLAIATEKNKLYQTQMQTLAGGLNDKFNEYDEKIESLEKENKTIKEQFQSSMRQLEQIIHSKDIQIKQITENHNQQMQRLTHQKNDLQQQLTDKNNELMQALEKNVQVQNLMADKITEIEQLKTSILDFQQKIADKQAQIEQQIKQFREKESQLSSLINQKDLISQNLLKVEQELKQKTSKLEEYQTKIASLEQTFKQYSKNLDNLSDKEVQLKKMIDNQKQHIAKLQNISQGTTEQRDKRQQQLIKQLRDAKVELQQANNLNKMQKSQKMQIQASLNQQIANKQSIIQTIEASLANLQEQLKNITSEKQIILRQLQQSNNRYNEISEQNGILSQSEHSLKVRIEQIQQQLKDLQGKMQNSDPVIPQTVEPVVQQNSAQNQELNKKLISLQQCIDDLQMQNFQETKKCEDLETQLNYYFIENNNLKQQIRDLEIYKAAQLENKIALQNCLQSEYRKQNQLEQQLKKFAKENQLLEQKLIKAVSSPAGQQNAGVQQILKEKQQIIQAQKQHLRNLQGKINELEVQKNSLNKEIQSLNEEIFSFNSENNERQYKIDELQSENERLKDALDEMKFDYEAQIQQIMRDNIQNQPQEKTTVRYISSYPMGKGEYEHSPDTQTGYHSNPNRKPLVAEDQTQKQILQKRITELAVEIQQLKQKQAKYNSKRNHQQSKQMQSLQVQLQQHKNRQLQHMNNILELQFQLKEVKNDKERLELCASKGKDNTEQKQKNGLNNNELTLIAKSLDSLLSKRSKRQQDLGVIQLLTGQKNHLQDKFSRMTQQRGIIQQKARVLSLQFQKIKLEIMKKATKLSSKQRLDLVSITKPSQLAVSQLVKLTETLAQEQLSQYSDRL